MVDLGGRDRGNISLPQRLQAHTGEDDGGGEPRAMPTIINMQRTFYSIKIQDIENKIDRLEKRNDELSEEIETIDEDNATVDAETAEEIANLTKQVSSQDNVIKSVKLRIETVEDNRVKDKESFEEATELFRQKYKNEKVELVSQIKVLNARINVLEDFKKVQAGLEEKLTSNQEQISRNEENVDGILKDIRRKIEFDKEIVKNDMYVSLFALAADFQLETSKFISLPNQRLMRENIMLKNELQQTSQTVSSMMGAQNYLKDSAGQYQTKIHSRLSIVKRNIMVDKVQGDILKRLRKRLSNLQQQYLSVNIPDPAAADRCLLLIDHARQEEGEAQFRSSSLKALLYRDRVKVSVAKYLLRILGCKIKAAVGAIYDLKYAAMCLLKCPYTRKDLQKLSCIELFLFLKDILNKGQEELGCLVAKSLESIPRNLDAEEDLEKIHEPYDLKTTDPTEGSSVKEIFEKIQLEKRTEISGEDEAENVFDDRSSIVASVASTLPQNYEVYGEDEFEGELGE